LNSYFNSLLGGVLREVAGLLNLEAAPIAFETCSPIDHADAIVGVASG
jgi:hypothetical protein